MKGRLLVGFCLSLLSLGSLAAQLQPPTQGQAKDPPLVQGATRGSSGLWEIQVNVGPSTFEMVQVPAGNFKMGTDNPNGKLGWSPTHSVTITRPFLMQKTHVTVAQFRAFVDATGYLTEAEHGVGAKVYVGLPDGMVYKDKVNWRNPAFEHEVWSAIEFEWQYKDDLSRSDPSVVQVDTCPVVCVSWNDAQAFVQWLNAKGGEVAFRLPTEAEWEYACRAGSSEERYGNLDDIAWYERNSDGHTHPVGQKQPNAFGLFDMLGNVYQWCQDVFARDYYTSSPSQDPQGPKDGAERVDRGGSYQDGGRSLWAAARDFTGTSRRNNFTGFRLVAVARTQ
jgi:formylglycine-generating enzyme required for sulfatase activity